MHCPDTHAARPDDVQPVEAAAGLAAFAEALDDDAFAEALLKFALCVLVSLVIGFWYRN
jgi:hypothetical protein